MHYLLDSLSENVLPKQRRQVSDAVKEESFLLSVIFPLTIECKIWNVFRGLWENLSMFNNFLQYIFLQHISRLLLLVFLRTFVLEL